MSGFVKRNVKIYFRDRSAVLFSLLGVIIVVALYIIFLADNLASGVKALEGGDVMMNCWLVAGVCAIVPVTTGMGALGTLTDDRAKGIWRDFLSSPIKRTRLVAGYLASGLAASAIMSLAALFLGWAWLLATGATLPGAATMAAILGAQLLAVVSGGTMVFFIVTFFHTIAAFTAASTVLGTIIGFLTGIYLPMALLPAPVQTVVKLFPTAHVAALLRSLFIKDAADVVFAGAPSGMRDEFLLSYGARFEFWDKPFPLWGNLLVALLASLMFFALSVLNFSRPASRR